MQNPIINKLASDKQLYCLQELGIKLPGPVSSFQANQLIKANQERWKQLPPTDAQEWRLKQMKKWVPNLTRGEASEIIEKEVEDQEAREPEFPGFYAGFRKGG